MPEATYQHLPGGGSVFETHRGEAHALRFAQHLANLRKTPVTILRHGVALRTIHPETH